MTSNEVAQRDNTPSGMVQHYADSFRRVLPTHITAEQFVRLSQAALKRGKQENGRYVLEVAAENDVGLFLATLLEAARLGLEPGTEHFYLTPRKNKGKWQILGIVGYMGYIELMYRAGAQSIIVETVREKDTYRYDRGVDLVPVHTTPKLPGGFKAPNRGNLVGVYAYARFKDGAVSRVVELGEDDIALIKIKSASAQYPDSPWNTDTEAMWLKSAARQLRKWVPTSAEYRAQFNQATTAALSVSDELSLPMPLSDDDVLDGELVDAQPWPETKQPAES